MVASVVEHLALPEDARAEDVAARSWGFDLPSAPSELVNDPGSALARAERLQLVAVTYPSSDVNGEQLWERSQIAVAHLPPQDEVARMLRARAALHLYRRPYAVALLRGSNRPEARALFALAQGNLFDAESLVPQMTDPVAALITEVELEVMRARYARSGGLRERRRALNFSQYDFAHVSATQPLLERLGNRPAGEQVAAQARERFMGNPARDEFLLNLAEHMRDTAALRSLVEQQIRERPEEWSLYYRLAQVQLQAREPRQAQRALLAYPLWRREKADAVALSNRAQEGGMLLLRAGEGDLARPLFQIGAAYGTGSGAELWSGLWLARLDHNWPEIRNWGRRLHQQHQDGWGLSDAAYASFLIGDPADGWRTFYEASKQFEDARPWVAAVAGHRIAATSDDELIGFAKHWKSLSGNAAAEAALRQQFVFGALMLDRSPGDRTFAYLIAPASNAADPIYAPLATGYRAFKRGDYAGAIEHLTKFSEVGARPSPTVQQQGAVAVPYLAASLTKMGRGAEAQAVLTDFQKRAGRDFYYLLASDYVQGLSGDRRAALDDLWQAQLSWPDLEKLSVPPPFQVLEAAEKLYELTGDARYKEALLDLARRQRVMWPWWWTYAFEAKHATDPRDREAALGVALYLDAQSEHLAGFNEAQRKRAQRWFAANNPFKKP
jgi:hypothetical protein